MHPIRSYVSNYIHIWVPRYRVVIFATYIPVEDLWCLVYFGNSDVNTGFLTPGEGIQPTPRHQASRVLGEGRGGGVNMGGGGLGEQPTPNPSGGGDSRPSKEACVDAPPTPMPTPPSQTVTPAPGGEHRKKKQNNNRKYLAGDGCFEIMASL